MSNEPKESVVSNIRNVPHAEIQVKWLSDDSMDVQYEEYGLWHGTSMKPGWFSDVSYRLVKKVPAVKKYHVAYLHPENNSWIISYHAEYTTVEDFYTKYKLLRGTKAEIIQASMVQSDESVEVVFVSPATE